MPCPHNPIDCPCTKEGCPRHGKCCACVAHHKAACVWTLLGKNYSKEQLEQYCFLYGITTEQALNWKDYWLNQ